MSGSNLPRTYDAKGAEERFYPWWEENGFFQGDPEGEGEPYSIVIPPPNVTGSLHMGHALNNAIQDFLIRYKRMDGYNAVWIPGTDHAGIATQWVVERQLREQGLDRRDMGREAFLERVWAWKEESGSVITHQLRSLGVSCDWSRERFTMDEGLSAAVRHVFVKLYESGLIYRGTRMINWDPVGQTVLSDLEVEHEENYQGEMWSFAYPLAEGGGEIVVATTRPETMLGDTAVAVHPDDPRYVDLVGKMVRHPLLDREFPIVADAELVDPEFGTGAVKVTPAHDPNDFGVGKRHDLPFLTVLDDQARVNELGGRFEGLDRYEARTAVKEAMAELGLDRGTEPHLMSVGRSQRSGAIVEPMISTQWFVKMGPLAEPAIEAVENGETKFIPERWENTYFAWMRDIRDWCISRQLWWGHQIPAWYCDDCDAVTVAMEDPTACSACGSASIRRDEDVLDTWFSSALWPFSTLGWPSNTPELSKWYPTAVLVTGFDIIFFWVARMLFSGIHHMGGVPFADVFIHGLVRDTNGEKMSKTKGNVVDPLKTIEAHGCDAFRFTLAQYATQGRDILWDDNRVEVNSRFINKIWQAFRFADMNLEDFQPGNDVELGAYDRWILVRTGEAVRRVREAMDGHRFNEVATEIHAFVVGEFCDWYIEFSKQAIYGDGPERGAAQQTLVEVLAAIARLIHPVMPFLSEEIWQQLPDSAKGGVESVMMAPYPKASDFPEDPELLAAVAPVQESIGALRKLKADMGLAPRLGISVLVDGEVSTALMAHEGALAHLAGVERLEPLRGEEPANCATLPVSGGRLVIPLDGLVDIDAERARLTSEIEKTSKDVNDLEKRLSNEGFVARAPAQVVDGFRVKLAGATEKLDKYKAALKEIS
ncbi:MAG: valine--tRNA ligase [Myxococcota bacterium]|nr:valine--tRNA ligase [Myxococcota bacterium]